MNGLAQMSPTPLGSLRLQLGESPIWDKQSSQLLCVDIERHNIHRLDLDSGNVETKLMERLPAAIGLCRSGRLIVGKIDGVFLTDFGTELTNKLCNPVAHQPSARLNDGKVAPDGSFWIGSMENNIASNEVPTEITTNIGRFYRVEANGTVEQLVHDDLGIANTLAWSPDQKYFFYADSMNNSVYRTELKDAKPANTVVFNSDFNRGAPDGSAMDAEGYLWNCRWGGSCVVRFSPDGQVDQVIEMPATNITSCAFGGPGNNILFVTSARSGLDTNQLADNPLEGSIFAINTPVTGMDISEFTD